MNPPQKNPDKTREDLADLLRITEPEGDSVIGAPDGSGMTWYCKNPDGTRRALTSADGINWTQTIAPPMRVYGANLWPWYLRGPFCAWLRNWYARRHPEIFGEDYQ